MATPGFLEEYAKDYATQAKGAYSVPIDTSQFTGRDFVAGEDPLQTKAITMAEQGLEAYKPFLEDAQAFQKQAGETIGGLGALSGTGMALQPGVTAGSMEAVMSPYQQQVIDTSLQAFRDSRNQNRQSIQDAAVATGNFGGGREGAMLGQYDADTASGRAALQAGLLQQGFTQANQLAQQAFANQGTLAQNQFGLSNFQRTGMGQDIGALGNLGALNQQQAQANLLANQQAAKTAAYEPYGRLQQYGQGLTGLAGGVASAYAEPAPVQSPLSQALSTALGVGGIYSRLYGGQKI